MLPGFLDSTYKRYKQDTSVFIEWLSENAKKCGYKPTEGTSTRSKPTQASTKTPRLKGKARKEAKQASSNGKSNAQSTSSAANKPPQFVNSKELLPQAKAIAHCENPSIEVPIGVIQAGLRAVSARKRCTSYFKSKTAPDDTQTLRENAGHSYFIDLMEEVLLALQPRFAVSEGAKAISNSSSAITESLENLENRFAALEVEEPVEVDHDTVTLTIALSEKVYELIPPESKTNIEEEKIFALFCLFDDLARLRRFLDHLWMEYLSGKIDLITASVTTNTAFQLAIRAQDEILEAHPSFGDYQNVLSTLIAVFDKTQTLEYDDEIEIDDDVADWIYLPAHSILDDFCDVLKPTEVPLMERGHFGIYDPLADRANMSDVLKQHMDKILLMELLPEFCFIGKYNIKLFATDELTRGLSRMALTKEIPVWLLFAATILLDIHHLLRQKTDRAFAHLHTTASHAKRTLSRHMQFSQGMTAPATWPKESQRVLQQFARSIDEGILKDIILPLKELQYKDFNHPYSVDTERFYLYKRHPVLCGILELRITLELEHIGVYMVQGWGTAIFPAQFYNALQQQQTLTSPWPLMDEAIALHGERRVFIGGRPKTIEDCYKQVCLTLGYSAEQFARNRRQHKPVVSKTGPRGLDDASPLGELIREGFTADRSIALTIHNIEEFLNKQALDAATISNPQNKSLRREWDRSHRLTSIQLLEALQASIRIELSKLKLDYSKLHEQSITLLRRLREALDSDLRKYTGGNYIENESQLPFVGLWIISIAMNTGKAAEELGISDAGSKMLQKSSGVFELFLAEQH